MRPGERGQRGACGFTYLGVLALVAVLGLLLSAAGQVVATVARRERETQLLWVGHEYREAIGRYWSRRHAYPPSLEALLGGPADAPLQVRDLRARYPDPMTNGLDWVLVPAPGGGIMGVASSSGREPLRTAHFDDADRDFEGASTYGDWQFTFRPGVIRRRPP